MNDFDNTVMLEIKKKITLHWRHRDGKCLINDVTLA